LFVIKILANRDAIFFVSSNQNMLQPDFVDTFNGFFVHLKWIRCTPEMDFVDTFYGFVVHLKWILRIPWVDFVDTISLNILIKFHTETALFIVLSTRKPALLHDSDSAINISTFCYSVLCTVDLMDTLGGFCGYL
jgi:hypothetical protein